MRMGIFLRKFIIISLFIQYRLLLLQSKLYTLIIMKKIITPISLSVLAAISLFVGYQYVKSEESSLFSTNVEALASAESGSGYVICYSKSIVRIGHTYYDCGTCTKVYDEKGYGHYTKCFK